MTTLALQPQLIEAPLSTDSRTYESLGYIEAYDAPLNSDYAFVAYKETEVSSGNSIVRIQSKNTSGALFEPAAIRQRCREAGAKGQPFFTWGYSFSPSASDVRCIEFRVHQQDGRPQALEIYLVTRQADGSAQEPKSLRIEPFMAEPAPAAAPLVEAPASDANRLYETLGYVAAYDAVLNCDYAFVAYKETDRGTGAWRVYVKSTQTAGASMDPVAIRLKARETGSQGKAYFIWGYSFEPSASDPRQVEFRVHVAGGAPQQVELYVRLRKASHSPDAPHSVTFPWPRG